MRSGNTFTKSTYGAIVLSIESCVGSPAVQRTCRGFTRLCGSLAVRHTSRIFKAMALPPGGEATLFVTVTSVLAACRTFLLVVGVVWCCLALALLVATATAAELMTGINNSDSSNGSNDNCKDGHRNRAMATTITTARTASAR